MKLTVSGRIGRVNGEENAMEMLLLTLLIIPTNYVLSTDECQSDDCSKASYRTGKKCLSNDQDTIPSFNGSSYLTYAPLDDKALIWFELKVNFSTNIYCSALVESRP